MIKKEDAATLLGKMQAKSMRPIRCEKQIGPLRLCSIRMGSLGEGRARAYHPANFFHDGSFRLHTLCEVVLPGSRKTLPFVHAVQVLLSMLLDALEHIWRCEGLRVNKHVSTILQHGRKRARTLLRLMCSTSEAKAGISMSSETRGLASQSFVCGRSFFISIP